VSSSLATLQESLTHYAESLRAKDFSNVGRRILQRLVRVLCELASDPRSDPVRVSALLRLLARDICKCM
jgi:hypothetical protein